MELVINVINNQLMLEDGTILYNPAILYDTTAGLLRYGEAHQIQEYHNQIVNLYTVSNLTDMLEQIMFMGFDIENGELSIYEIKTFLNYAILSSANGDRIYQLTQMNSQELHARLLYLSQLGY